MDNVSDNWKLDFVASCQSSRLIREQPFNLMGGVGGILCLVFEKKKFCPEMDTNNILSALCALTILFL